MLFGEKRAIHSTGHVSVQRRYTDYYPETSEVSQPRSLWPHNGLRKGHFTEGNPKIYSA